MVSGSRQAKYGGHVVRRGGFTLIELLVVIAILAVLVTLGLLGFSKVAVKSRESATRQTLEGLKGLLQEAGANGLYKDSRQPAGVYESDTQWRIRSDIGTTGVIPDFWRTPDSRSTTPATMAMTVPSVELDESGQAAWRDSRAVRSSALALALMSADPGVAKSLNGMPAKVKRLATFWSADKTYQAGERVLYATSTSVSNSGTGNGFAVYVARQKVTAGTTPTAGSDTVNWARDYAGVLDDWGHPIIYVSPQGVSVSVGGSPTVVKSSDGKGFWMSAGADGDLYKGDDNLYSFEN